MKEAWVALPGCREPVLCVAHSWPDRTGIFSHAHNELAWVAPEWAWGDEYDPRMAHWDTQEQFSAVKKAYAAGPWHKAHVAIAWVHLQPQGLVRAFGIAYKAVNRKRAAKAALAVMVHMILGEGRVGPYWWLKPLADQCQSGESLGCD